MFPVTGFMILYVCQVVLIKWDNVYIVAILCMSVLAQLTSLLTIGLQEAGPANSWLCAKLV